ncbi:pyridoxamine 5'-phosphate oxidase family protein [Streptomyces sp. NPDC091289]|uniref:pyridoxamine 5'-phosphate oxidase family protein n=1 Tax=Streptomyces sp. NPDC091289 TaxID=3365989 RepID=UPI0038113CEE
MIKTTYHEGEQAVQKRAGEGRPGWGSPMFEGDLLPGFGPYLLRQRMLFLGAADSSGAVWSSLVTGDPGFAAPLDQQTIALSSLPVPGDPLADAFGTTTDIGLLALEPHTTSRVRINGVAHRENDTLRIRTEQVLGNCPKYLQVRVPVADGPATEPKPARTGADLTPEQESWIRGADTFFIASRAEGHGADSSHRGGDPGFVSVAGPRKLVWPDYFGNSFYMTLGNLQLNPNCGLLFLDWESGSTLQLSGKARIDWDEDHRTAVPGALRMCEFDIEQVVQIDAATRLRWSFAGPSPYNPPAADGP